MAILAAPLACAPSDIFSGRWRSDGERAAEGPLFGGRVELVMGQFGDDVAGVIRLYEDPVFAVPAEGCNCLYLAGGNAQGSDLTLVLDLAACPALDQAYPSGVSLDLRRDEERRLDGTVTDLSDGSVVQELTVFLAEERLQRIFAEERTCPEQPGARP